MTDWVDLSCRRARIQRLDAGSPGVNQEPKLVQPLAERLVLALQVPALALQFLEAPVQLPWPAMVLFAVFDALA